MKINFLSDLHLEAGNLPENILEKPYVPTGDVVLLIGDITNARNLEMATNYFGKTDKPVLYIPGNHEYYGGNWDNHVDIMCKHYHTEGSNIKVMDDDYFKVDDVHFLGSTFWSDVAVNDAFDVARCVADFVWYHPSKHERPVQVIKNMTVDKQRQAHKQSVAYLDLMMGNIRRKDPEAKIVVFTHFPPSWKAQEERFRGGSLGSYFYSDNDYLIEKHQPNYWIYGHTHGNLCWDHGITKVLSNQCGYKSEYGNLVFDQHMEIEI